MRTVPIRYWAGVAALLLLAAGPAGAADPYEEGMRLYNAKQDRAALEQFNRAIAVNPRHVEAIVGRGLARYALRDYGVAIEDFSAAIRLKPDDEDAYIYRGKAYRALRQGNRALEDFTAATRVNPKSGKGYFERANTYQMLYANRPATALKDLDEAIRREPRNALYYNRRGGLLFETDQFDRAIGDFSQAIALQPTMATAYGNRGLAKYALDRKAEAAEDLRQCLVLDPKLREWIETQVQLIPRVQQWQAEFRRWYAAVHAAAARSLGDSCSSRYSYASQRDNCRSNGVNDTDHKIQSGKL